MSEKKVLERGDAVVIVEITGTRMVVRNYEGFFTIEYTSIKEGK